MNKVNSKQSGFAAIGIALIVVVLIVIGFVGWRFYESQQNGQANNSTTDQTSQSQPPEVNSNDDLQKAEDFLNDTDVNKQLDTAEIDSALGQ